MEKIEKEKKLKISRRRKAREGKMVETISKGKFG